MVKITCEELNSVWTLKKAIEREQRRQLDLQVFAESTTAVLDGMPHAKPMTFKVERIATLIAESREMISKLIERFVKSKFDLLIKIQSCKLDELPERVLSYHYVSCLTFKEIARLMNYTKEYISMLHGKGLKSLGLTVKEMTACKNNQNFVAALS